MEGQGEEACEGAGWVNLPCPVSCRVVLIERAEQVGGWEACNPIRVGIGEFGKGVGEGEDSREGV